MFGGKQKKKPNTEIDLVAFISLLSVCICFLLLTTIWIQIGSMNVKQAIGGQAATDSKPKPELWVLFENDGGLQFQLRNSPRKISRKYGKAKIKAIDAKPNLEEAGNYLLELKENFADINMALIKPTEKTLFEDIISLMDVCRDKGINDLGVTPI